MYNFLIYLIVLIITIWAIDGVNFNNVFKKNHIHIYQARVFYILIVLSLAYLASSFIISFLTSLK